MTAAEAISSSFRQYVGFRGRASTTEFWWFISLVWTIMLLAGLGDAYLFYIQVADQIESLEHMPNPLDALSTFFDLLLQYRPKLLQIPIIFLSLPALAVGARRMHDIGHTGWRQIPILFPLVFGIFCTVFAYLMREFGIFLDSTLLLPAFLVTLGSAYIVFANYDQIGDPGRNYYGNAPKR